MAMPTFKPFAPLLFRLLALSALLSLLAFPAGPRPPVAVAAPTVAAILRHQVAKLKAGDAAPGDLLGTTIAISGDTAVVGATNADDGRTDSGAAYVFERDYGGAGTWGQVARLAASDAGMYHYFGRGLAIAGDTVAVGAYAASPGGAVYLFQRDLGGPNAWGQLARITAEDTSWGDAFGYALDLDGDTLIVGAYAGGDYDGKAYIFYRDQGGPEHWGQVAEIVADDVAAYDYFGSAVAVSGDTVIVGSPGDDGLLGAAYVFRRDAGGPDHWGQVRKITAEDGLPTDFFGWPVAISGDTAAISAADRAPGGAAYVFYRDQGGPDNWGQVIRLAAGDLTPGSAFGNAADVFGDTIAVGAPGREPGGSTYLYARSEGGTDTWGQVARLEVEGAITGTAFGDAVAVDGELLAVGASGDEPGGSAYLFALANVPPDDVELSEPTVPVGEGMPMLLQGRFTDPDVNDQYTVTVDWGDGASSQAGVGGSGPTYLFTATHTYADGPNAYPLTATVEDLQGASASATGTITVNNVPPALGTLLDRSAAAGAPLTVTVAFTDPGRLDGHTVAFQWSETASWTATLSPGATALTATYTYARPALYTVTVAVTDDDGGADQGSFAVTVSRSGYAIYLPVIYR
jgi:hypothetical protein